MTATGSLAELKAGWRLLVACSLGIAGSAIAVPYYTIGAITKPVALATGWARADIQFAIAFSSGIGALTAPLTGWMIDRFGVRAVALPGFFGVALGMAIAGSAQSIWTFYAGFALAAILGAGTNPVLWSKVVTASFDKARGAALGLALVGTALSAIALPMVVTVLIAQFGWQRAVALVGLLPVLISLPVAMLWLKPKPAVRATEGTQTDSKAISISVRAALRGYRFWVLAASVLCSYLAVSGVLAGLVPAFTDRGFAPATAAALAGTVGLAMVPGRILVGFVIDRIWAPGVACAILLLPAAACLTLVSTSHIAVLAACCMTLGLAAGAELDLLAFLTARYFGLAHFARIYALLYAGLATGSALAPALFSLIRDRTGSYQASFQTSALLFVAAAVLLPLLGRYPSGHDDDQSSQTEPLTTPE
ncbi:MFS transporter [Novosphingobium sp. Chol11]|uniref:MFS transporter n=1 Tax=Novosphingobium sp. Chol11 TaxID=1385763 RepID=UPI0025F4D8A8|nr:MFS transporter [Novosphingobium sp. Chol11]